MSYSIGHFYRFGEFAVDADQLVLLRGGKPVPLRPKVFDTLLVLVEHHGRIVGKNELMDRLWPDSFVEEDNLTFNIRQLRKALGDDARWPRYVETVARRGYRFIAEVEEVLADTSEADRHLIVAPNSSDVSGQLYETSRAIPCSAAPLPSEVDNKPEGVSSLLSAQHNSRNTRTTLLVVAGLVAILLGTTLWGLYLRKNANRVQYNRHETRRSLRRRNASQDRKVDGVWKKPARGHFF